MSTYKDKEAAKKYFKEQLSIAEKEKKKAKGNTTEIDKKIREAKKEIQVFTG